MSICKICKNFSDTIKNGICTCCARKERYIKKAIEERMYEILIEKIPER